MPFNDEQVRVVQLLECSDGVVVQGPPGTGKTHTIGNIICHYLALGKRVLVTSMKDPALVILQDKLPAEIRPLAISLLTSEQEGMKQFMYAVEKIAAEVQRLDKLSLSREITQIENSIDAYHAKLVKIDNQIGEWAGKNLTPIELDGEILKPLEAAEIVIRNEQTASWLEDAISIGTEFRPRFSDSGIVRLRDARRALLNDLDYLGVTLPLISAFPDARELIRAHQDLARAAELQSQVDSGKVTPLADSSKQTFDAAQSLLSQISNLKLLYQFIQNNDDLNAALNYPDAQLTDSVHDPGQAWNVLTVGAYTELDEIRDSTLNGFNPIACSGGLSPFTTTSLTWENRWPIKPEIVMEGGNLAHDGQGFYDEGDDLSLLSTYRDPATSYFYSFNITSASTALAAWLASRIQKEYPDIWPETIRALMVHSAE